MISASFLRKLVLALAIPLCVSGAHGQTSANISEPAHFAGLYRALAYAYGSGSGPGALYVARGNPTTGPGSTLVLKSGYITLADGQQIMPLSTNAPITIGYGTVGETVTPTAVSCSSPGTFGTCTITANFTLCHNCSAAMQATNQFGESVSSGTFGLQEALNHAAAIGGGGVMVSKSWYNAGGTSAMVAAALVPSGTSITDTSLGTFGSTNAVTINGGAVPASQSALASNASGQIIAGTPSTNALTVNGASVPASQAVIATNSTGQLIAGTASTNALTVNGASVPASAAIVGTNGTGQIISATPAFSSPVTATQINTVFYVDGYPAGGCTVVGGVYAGTYTTQYDCAKATASKWVTDNTLPAVLVIGAGTYQACAALQLPTASGNTLSMRGQGYDKTTIHQNCSITDAVIDLPYNATKITGAYFEDMKINASANAYRSAQWSHCYQCVFKNLYFLGGTNGDAEGDMVFIDHGSGNDIVENWFAQTTGGASPRAQVSAQSISAGTVSFTVPATGGGAGYNSNTTAYVLGGGNSTSGGKWVCATLPTETNAVTVTSGAVVAGTYTMSGGVGCNNGATIYVQIDNTPTWAYIFDFQLYDSTLKDISTSGVATKSAIRLGGGTYGGGAIHAYHLHWYGGTLIGLEDHGNNVIEDAEDDSHEGYAIDFEGSATVAENINQLWDSAGPPSGNGAINVGYAGAQGIFVNTSGGANNIRASALCSSTQANGYNTVVGSAGADSGLQSSYNTWGTLVTLVGFENCGANTSDQVVVHGNLRVYGAQATVYSSSSQTSSQIQFQSPRTDMDTMQMGEASGTPPAWYVRDAAINPQTMVNVTQAQATFQPPVSASINGGSGLTASQVAAPGAGTATPTGTAGATTYTYGCTAFDALGVETTQGTTFTTTTGNATLTSGNYNALTCSPPTGSIKTNFYRTVTVGSFAAGLICSGSAPGATCKDIGQTATTAWTAVPSTNLTGNVAAVNALVLGSSLASVTWTRLSGAPSGACTNGSLLSRTDTGALYVCQASLWVAK